MVASALAHDAIPRSSHPPLKAARAAAIADRILFLADRLIVRDVGRSDVHDVIAANGGASTMIRVSVKRRWASKPADERGRE